MVHAVRLAIARQLAGLRLHRWRVDPQSPTTHYREKRRTRLAELTVPLGNAYLRQQGALSEVLPLQAWIDWECAIAVSLGRDVRPVTDGRGLRLPFCPGQSLASVLRSKAPLKQKLQAVSNAAVALRRLHNIVLSHGDMLEWPLSHGDATSHNVVVDPDTETAEWIDFDMRHRRPLASVLRQADDLRALLWSSASGLDPSHYRACINAIDDGYADTEVMKQARTMTISCCCPTVFQLAQSPLTAAEFGHLREVSMG